MANDIFYILRLLYYILQVYQEFICW